MTISKKTQQLWEDYVELERAGQHRKTFLLALDSFINELVKEDATDITCWVEQLLRHLETIPINPQINNPFHHFLGFSIRTPLLKKVIIPELIKGWKAKNITYIRWIILAQHFGILSNLAEITGPREGFQTLIMSILALNPTDQSMLFLLITQEIRFFELCTHNLPDQNLLYGNVSATLNETFALKLFVAQVRIYIALLDSEHQQLLEEAFPNYHSFLDQCYFDCQNYYAYLWAYQIGEIDCSYIDYLDMDPET